MFFAFAWGIFYYCASSGHESRQRIIWLSAIVPTVIERRPHCGLLGDCLKCMRGFTEAFFWIQLVAEGSSSTCRAFGVAIAKVRQNYDEGSAFQLNQMIASAQSKKSISTCEVENYIEPELAFYSLICHSARKTDDSENGNEGVSG